MMKFINFGWLCLVTDAVKVVESLFQSFNFFALLLQFYVHIECQVHVLPPWKEIITSSQRSRGTSQHSTSATRCRSSEKKITDIMTNNDLALAVHTCC